MLLRGKTAIVTGAAKGIGKAIAELFLAEGAAVLITDIDADELNKTRAELKKTAERITSFPVDSTDKLQVAELLKYFFAGNQRLDILVNNAGIGGKSQVKEMTEEFWENILKNNLTSVFTCCKAVVPYMIEQDYGKIINISSIYGIIGAGEASAYAAAKGGINSFTKSLALEVARYNINVNAVAPGVIRTSMVRKETIDVLGPQIPCKRLGLPEEIAGPVAFLASDLASYINGHVLNVNGGLVMV